MLFIILTEGLLRNILFNVLKFMKTTKKLQKMYFISRMATI